MKSTSIFLTLFFLSIVTHAQSDSSSAVVVNNSRAATEDKVEKKVLVTDMKPELKADEFDFAKELKEVEFPYEIIAAKGVKLSMREVTRNFHYRYLLEFQNTSSKHFLIFEKHSAFPKHEQMDHLMRIMSNTSTTIDIKLSCKGKTFCTENCKHKYYWTSNNPNDPIFLNNVACRFVSYRAKFN